MIEIDKLIGINKKCDIHKRCGISLASLREDDPNPFYCSTCVVVRNQQFPFVSIEDILTSDLEFPIQNWPLGITNECIQFLNGKEFNIIEAKIRRDLFMFYESLQNKINVAIDQSRKQQLMYLDQINLGSQEEIKFYNQQFQRKELFRIFENYGPTSKDEYLQLLGSLKNTSKNGLDSLELKINEKKKIENDLKGYQDQQIKALQKQFITIVDDLSLSFFNNEIISQDESRNIKYDFKTYDDVLSTEMIETLNKKSQNQVDDHQLNFDQNDDFDYKDKITKGCVLLNPSQKKGKINFKEQIDSKLTQTFILTFPDLESLNNFQFGVSTYNQNTLKTNKYYFKEIQMNELISNVKRHNKDGSYKYQITLNIKKKLLEVKLDNFSINYTPKLPKCKSNLFYSLFFYLKEKCKGLELSEFLQKQDQDIY